MRTLIETLRELSEWDRHIDVFFCMTDIRPGMTVRCREAWQVPLWHLRPYSLGCTAYEFQKQRRVFADLHASGKYYIVADDDCLPPEGDWMTKAVEIMDRHPDFGILSLWPSNAVIQKWTPEGYTPFEDNEVVEHVSVGNLRVCRKGALKEWPEQTTSWYDMAHCDGLRANGYRAGYFKNISMVHLGEGKTTLT